MSVLQVTIEDVRNFSKRMLERENQADNLLSQMQGVFKQVESMKEYCDEMNSLNDVVSNQSRTALIHSIRKEDRYILQLSQENKELRVALEEQQNVMELIMSKYREQVAKLIGNRENVDSIQQSIMQKKVLGGMERVYEMAMVMKNAALLDEQESERTGKVITALDIENKTLRELLKISATYGSLPPPKKCDANTQTEQNVSHEIPTRRRKHLDTMRLNPLFQETSRDVSIYSDVSSDEEEMSKTSDSIQSVISVITPENKSENFEKNHSSELLNQPQNSIDQDCQKHDSEVQLSDSESTNSLDQNL